MTASSLNYPCQVNLIMVPPVTTRGPPPSRQEVKRICKNLFGSAEPGEISEIYKKNEERVVKYTQERYSVDLKKIGSQPQHAPLPYLIQKEMEAYERKSKENAAPDSIKEISVASDKLKQSHHQPRRVTNLIEQSSKKSSRNINNKPYPAQNTITAYFSKCKTNFHHGSAQILSGSSDEFNQRAGDVTAIQHSSVLEVALKELRKLPRTMELAKPMCATLSDEYEQEYHEPTSPIPTNCSHPIEKTLIVTAISTTTTTNPTSVSEPIPASPIITATTGTTTMRNDLSNFTETCDSLDSISTPLPHG